MKESTVVITSDALDQAATLQIAFGLQSPFLVGQAARDFVQDYYAYMSVGAITHIHRQCKVALAVHEANIEPLMSISEKIEWERFVRWLEETYPGLGPNRGAASCDS